MENLVWTTAHTKKKHWNCVNYTQNGGNGTIVKMRTKYLVQLNSYESNWTILKLEYFIPRKYVFRWK